MWLDFNSIIFRVIVETDPSVILQRIAIKVHACRHNYCVCEHIIMFLGVIGGFRYFDTFIMYHSSLFIYCCQFQGDDGAFTEQSMKQVFQSAKENLKWSLLK